MKDFWHLQSVNWLDRLPEAGIESFKDAAEIREFGPSELIFEPVPLPKDVYILQSGLVRIYRESRDGEQVTFGYVHPGEVFGELAALGGKARQSFAVAVERSVVLRVGRNEFAAALERNLTIAGSVAKQIGGRLKQIESRVENLVFRSARSRLADMILHLASEFGGGGEDHEVIGPRFTHAELATLIGSSRPTVSIAIGELEDEGLISRADGRTRILDRQGLQRVATE